MDKWLERIKQVTLVITKLSEAAAVCNTMHTRSHTQNICCERNVECVSLLRKECVLKHYHLAVIELISAVLRHETIYKLYVLIDRQ